MNCSNCGGKLTRSNGNSQYDVLMCLRWQCPVHHQPQRYVLVTPGWRIPGLGDFQNGTLIQKRTHEIRKYNNPAAQHRPMTQADVVNSRRKKNNYALLREHGFDSGTACLNMSDKRTRALLGGLN